MTTKQSDHETPGVLAPRFVPLQSHHVTSQTGGEAHGETLCRPAGTTQRTDGSCTQVSARPSASRRPAAGARRPEHEPHQDAPGRFPRRARGPPHARCPGSHFLSPRRPLHGPLG